MAEQDPKKEGMTSRLFSRGKRFAKNAVAADEIKEHSGYVAGLAKKLVTPARSDREETFAAARMRLGLSDSDLAQRHKELTTQFYLFFFFLVIDVVLAVWFVFQGSVTSLLACVGFLAFCGAQMVASSFRASQIQLDELIDFSTWVARKDLWIPGEYASRGPSGGAGKTDMARRPKSDVSRKDK